MLCLSQVHDKSVRHSPFVNSARHFIRLYKRDIVQYDPNNKLYIEEMFNLIPPELNAKNKRFILKRLNEHAKFDRVENSFLWLINAGVALPVYNVEEPKMPFLLARSRNLFKFFQSDIGLLASQYAEGIQMRIIKGDTPRFIQYHGLRRIRLV